MKLNSKKDGKGKVSSFTINIAKSEAEALGWEAGVELVKIVNKSKKYLIIKKG